jgi:hypothetical protein
MRSYTSSRSTTYGRMRRASWRAGLRRIRARGNASPPLPTLMLLHARGCVLGVARCAACLALCVLCAGRCTLCSVSRTLRAVRCCGCCRYGRSSAALDTFARAYTRNVYARWPGWGAPYPSALPTATCRLPPTRVAFRPPSPALRQAALRTRLSARCGHCRRVGFARSVGVGGRRKGVIDYRPSFVNDIAKDKRRPSVLPLACCTVHSSRIKPQRCMHKAKPGWPYHAATTPARSAAAGSAYWELVPAHRLTVMRAITAAHLRAVTLYFYTAQHCGLQWRRTRLWRMCTRCDTM